MHHIAGRDPYSDLAGAIVAVAADDYRRALKDGDDDEVEELERFFRSDWYEILTDLDQERLICMLREEFVCA